MGVVVQLLAPVPLNPGKPLGIYCTEDRAGLGAALDEHGKLASTKVRTTGHLARSKSLYRLQYSSHSVS